MVLPLSTTLPAENFVFGILRQFELGRRTLAGAPVEDLCAGGTWIILSGKSLFTI